MVDEDSRDEIGTFESDPDLNERIRCHLISTSLSVDKYDNGYLEHIMERWGYDVVKAEGIVRRFQDKPRKNREDFISVLENLKSTGLNLENFSNLRIQEMKDYYYKIAGRIRSNYNSDSGPLPKTPFEVYSNR